MSAGTVAVFVALAAGLLTAGCGTIEFASDTVVEADGSVARTTRFSAAGRSFYEELIERYELPAGGTWTEIEPEPAAPDEPAVPEWIYTLTRRFAPGEPLTADFARRSAAGTAAARNEITIRVRRYWIADTYRYEETFGDIVTADSFAAAARHLYAAVLRALAEELAGLPAAGVTVDESAARLGARVDPLVEGFLRVLSEECFRANATREQCEAAVEDDPALDYFPLLGGDDAQALRALADLFPPPTGVTAEAWRGMLRSDVLEPLAEREDLQSQILFDAVEEDMFGVHGFSLFVSYPFELSVALPGDHVASNAGARASGVLRWSFDSDDFAWNPQTLYARSRIVHWERIFFVLTLAVALAGIATPSRRERAGGRG